MKNAEPSLSARPAGVELLILRILRRGFASTLVTGAIGALGCESGHGDDPSNIAQEPSPVGANDGAVGSHDGAVGALDAGNLAPSIDARVPSPADASDAAASADASADAGATTAPSCTADQPPKLRASGLTTVGTFDYVALRQVSDTFEPVPDAGSELSWTVDQFTTLSETGSACATASSGACADKVAHHPAQFVRSYCVQACIEYAVVTTRGDEVKRWATDSELLTLLGKIDSADEALLFALRAGFSAECVSQGADGLSMVATRYKSTCPIAFERVTLRVSETGKLEVVGAVDLPNHPGTGACVGRVPAGLCSVSEARHDNAVGDFLAHSAHLEDASAYAFERLARELSAHGAPRPMIAEALHAADDEVRHARVMGALARARGGGPVAAEVTRLPLRTLEEVAIENVTEGCVRETYGALVGGYQARHAEDLGVRTAMREVAADEARHAALSHRVHTWALSQLDAPAQGRVLAAQRRAIGQLTRACEAEVDARLRGPLGLPSAPLAQALLRELARSLWPRDESSAQRREATATDFLRRAV